VTYKKDVKDLRKSPSLKLIELLKKNTKVDYYDPLVEYVKLGGLDLNSIELTSANIKKYDVVVLAVDHSVVNYDLIFKNARLIFDTRNVYKDKRDKKVIKL